MSIEYIDRKTAKLVVSFGSGANRTRRTKKIAYKNKRDAERQYREFEDKVKAERTINTELTSEVSAQLGHASVDITLRVYTHLFTEASTASKVISDAINKKWAPAGHPKTYKKAVRLENTRLRMVRTKGLEPK